MQEAEIRDGSRGLRRSFRRRMFAAVTSSKPASYAELPYPDDSVTDSGVLDRVAGQVLQPDSSAGRQVHRDELVPALALHELVRMVLIPQRHRTARLLHHRSLAGREL